MKSVTNTAVPLVLLAGAALSLGGCGAMRGADASASDAAAPAAAAPSGPKAGLDAQGNVIDSSKVEGGSGRSVKGINDTDGEIIGNPAPGSKFSRLQVGMSAKQVTDLIGEPTDRGSYITGKAFIPFFYGADRHRQEFAYQGAGRLVFAGGGLGDLTGLRLIRIVHNRNDTGYR